VDPGTLLPAEARRAYDVRPIVGALLDSSPVELQPKWAPNVVTALGRLGGRPVGVVATNPLRMGGCLTAASSDKAARFVRMCDAFGIPLVVLVDVPGYLPGLKQETDGVVRRGAKLLHAFAACRVPRVTVVTRKAYGGAYIAMNSRSLGATKVYAWAGAEVDVMNATAAVRILRRRELAAVPECDRASAETAFAAEHARTTGGLSRALELKLVDAVIEPADTRLAILEALAKASQQRGRLTNIPL
jgi:acetyl-CoA/propionyl-CoA carboxylase carboxyl transferase subunit